MHYHYYRKLTTCFLSLMIILQLVSCKTIAPKGESIQHRDLIGTLDNIIPKPVSQNPAGGIFTLNQGFKIYIEPINSEIEFIGHYLADKMKRSTGCDAAVLEAKGIPQNGNLYLTKKDADPPLGDEGYELIITENLVTFTVFKPEDYLEGYKQ
jgi:hexosaminidase